MKKIIILFIALALFTSCKENKSSTAYEVILTGEIQKSGAQVSVTLKDIESIDLSKILESADIKSLEKYTINYGGTVMMVTDISVDVENKIIQLSLNSLQEFSNSQLSIDFVGLAEVDGEVVSVRMPIAKKFGDLGTDAMEQPEQPADDPMGMLDVTVDSQANIFFAVKNYEGSNEVLISSSYTNGKLPKTYVIPEGATKVKFKYKSENGPMNHANRSEDPQFVYSWGKYDTGNSYTVEKIQFETSAIKAPIFRKNSYTSNYYIAGVFLKETIDPRPTESFTMHTDSDENPNTNNETLNPIVQQAFYIGTGYKKYNDTYLLSRFVQVAPILQSELNSHLSGELRTYNIPTGATKLSLGFIDDINDIGSIAFYFDNTGEAQYEVYFY